MPPRRLFFLSGGVTFFLCLSRLFPRPSLVDLLLEKPALDAGLEYPVWRALFSPFHLLPELISCQGAAQDIALAAWLLMGFWGFRFLFLGRPLSRRIPPAVLIKDLFAYTLILAAFIAWSLLAARRGPRIIASHADDFIVDFHSHTSRSWDGRRSFTPASNALWHHQAGFNAGFITDHDVWTANSLGPDGYAAFAGEELSLHRAHMVLLGGARDIIQGDYAGPDGALRLAADAYPRYGALALMSLPEYWKHGWSESELEGLASQGLAGLEIHTASPRGMDFPVEERRRAATFCRRWGLFAAAASDNHGYSPQACAYNLVRLPGWQSLNADQRQAFLLKTLQNKRFAAVRIIAHNRPAPWTGAWLWLDPWQQAWALVRGWTLLPWACALIWAWVPPLVLVLYRFFTRP